MNNFYTIILQIHYDMLLLLIVLLQMLDWFYWVSQNCWSCS